MGGRDVAVRPHMYDKPPGVACTSSRNSVTGGTLLIREYAAKLTIPVWHMPCCVMRA